MKVLILGIRGYIGYALAQHLSSLGIKVTGIDNNIRQHMVEEVGSSSLFPIKNRPEPWKVRTMNVADSLLGDVLKCDKPDVVVHLAEQPSAPYSQIDAEHAIFTQENNVLGTLNVLWEMKKHIPKAHLIKLGTMGEYGTPPDGKIPENEEFIMRPGSFYHASKCLDSLNIRLACKIWKLRATDLNQGVVWGHYANTRFDYDSYFGTVINRFVVQAVLGYPLTVYGKGGQTRGYINLQNSLDCITLAIKNPTKLGEFRIFNQLTEVFSINEIARIVLEHFPKGKVRHIKNPRIEQEKHLYEPIAKGFSKMGLQPVYLKDQIGHFIELVKTRQSAIRQKAILPRTNW